MADSIRETRAMPMYLLQVLHEDGVVTAEIKFHSAHLIERLGHRDCSGEEIKIFDVSTFGAAVPLQEVAVPGEPPNYHRLINPETGRIVIEGYSSIH